MVIGIFPGDFNFSHFHFSWSQLTLFTLLTNRAGTGRQPTRVVLDAQLRTPTTCRLIATASAESPVLVATTTRALEAHAGGADVQGVEHLVARPISGERSLRVANDRVELPVEPKQAHHVIVPVETGYFSLHGLSKQLATLSVLSRVALRLSSDLVGCF